MTMMEIYFGTSETILSWMHVFIPESNITPLALDAIAQATHAQCDVEGNVYLLLKCFTDVQKDPTTINLDENKGISFPVSACKLLPQVDFYTVNGKMIPHHGRNSLILRSLRARLCAKYSLVGTAHIKEM